MFFIKKIIITLINFYKSYFSLTKFWYINLKFFFMGVIRKKSTYKFKLIHFIYNRNFYEELEQYQALAKKNKENDQKYWKILNEKAILMKSFNEKKQEIYYPSGHCSLQEYINILNSKNLLVPGEVIVATFKFMIQFVQFFYQEYGFFHGDLKPDNLILNHVGG